MLLCTLFCCCLQYETELRGALQSVTRDRDVEVKRLSGRLEDANALLARTQEEHRAALGSYEAQIARWKEEAKHLSEKLKGIHEEHQEVMQRRWPFVSSAAVLPPGLWVLSSVALQEVERIRESLLTQLKERSHAPRSPRQSSSSSEGEAIPAAVAAQLTELLNAEAVLISEKAQLRVALDRALLDKTRADRGRDGAQMKAAALQKQCDSLQVREREGQGAISAASPRGTRKPRGE